jgi:hypothetical protein
MTAQAGHGYAPLTTIVRERTLAEAIDTARMHHVAGLIGDRKAFVITRTSHLRGDHKRALSEGRWNPATPLRMQGEHPTAMTQGPAIGIFLSCDSLEAQRGHGLSPVAVSGIERQGERSSGVKESSATRGGAEGIRMAQRCGLPYPPGGIM